MHIAIVGTGYVGLVTGACFAEFGVNVTCVDRDVPKIESLLAGKVPIYEPGLDALIEKNARAGRIRFTTDLKTAVERALVVFIAVGTPPKPDGAPDLSQIEEVATQIAAALNGYKVIVTKSTVPTGTGQAIRRVMEEIAAGQRFSVASNPEFLREGDAINDFMHPERIVIGCEDAEATAILKDLYAPLVQMGTPLVATTVETSELIKYASNAFLATKISFINDMANLCDVLGCDVQDVARGMGLDSRIGNKFLHPGPGYGGSCFPKDTQALAHLAASRGYELNVVTSVIAVNVRQQSVMLDKIFSLLGDAPGKTVGILGLTFKPETSDLRESPAIAIAKSLCERGVAVRATDPVAIPEARTLLPDAEFFEDPYETAVGCDALVLATEWNLYRKLELDRLREAMRAPALADLRNLYDPAAAKRAGFRYVGVGRR
jgi:UDPglucose 6-dehydrogenase